MLRKLITAAVFVFASPSGFAQDRPVAVFSEPFVGSKCYRSQVIQCSNGKTFLVNLGATGGDFLLFDSNRKLVRRSNFTGKLAGASKGNESVIPLYFEHGGNLVLFLGQKLGGRQVMHRILISTDDGNIRNEQTIAELERHKPFSSIGAAFGGLPAEIIVVANKAAGNYAVIREDALAEDTSGRLEVDCYNAQHEKTGTYSYVKQKPGLKYIKFMAADFDKTGLVLNVHEFMTRSYGTEESNLVLTKLSPEGRSLQQQRLDLNLPLKGFSARLKYQPVNDRLILAVDIPNGNYKSDFQRFDTRLITIRGNDLSIESEQQLDLGPLDAYNRSVCDKSRDFSGMLLGWSNDPEGGINMVVAERMAVSCTLAEGNGANVVYNWKDIGVIKLDAAGKARKAVAIQQIAASNIDDSYVSVGGVDAFRNLTYFGIGKTMYVDWASSTEGTKCDYISTPNGDYFIRNHPHEAFDEPSCEKSRFIHPWKTSAALYTVSADGPPTREYLWGASDTYHAVMPGTSSYDPKTQTYSAVSMLADGKKMIIRIAWLRLP